MEDKLIEIKKDLQIKKFCAYGFLKNLKFFEPYLLIFLMSKGLNLFEIGVLISIREVVVNIFEIPSGFIADYFGRKKELCLCFIFYIISFICFFCTDSMLIAAVAMIFFGLGEAFRSGTHKAMIYTYLDHKAWNSYKTFVYGRTRSFSLIGSAISSCIGIGLILLVPSVNQIFLFSIIPYLLDFILIATYPDFIDCEDRKKTTCFKELFRYSLSDFKNNRGLRNIILEEGLFSSTISYIKDLIQPLLEAMIIGSGIVVISGLSGEEQLKVTLGIVYVFMNLAGSFSSKKAYIVQGKRESLHCLFWIHGLLAVSMIVLGLVSKNPTIVFIVYLCIYVIFNIRKPIFVDEIDKHMDKSYRVTVLSVASQLKSLLLVIFAPLLGHLADIYGISSVMFVLAAVFLITLPMLTKKSVQKK